MNYLSDNESNFQQLIQFYIEKEDNIYLSHWPAWDKDHVRCLIAWRKQEPTTSMNKLSKAF